jgi:WhiB family transcriptional regulator, redox-sensing transcriptional regulator
MSRVVQASSWGMRSVSWMSRGACQQADPKLFYPIATGKGQAARQAQAAKAVCAPCPVRAKCLSYALEARPEGIWGGTTGDERLKARAASARQARKAADQRVAPDRTA